MDAKQFAWIYLIENGYANVRPSYYGGWDGIDPNEDSIFGKRTYIDTREMNKRQAECNEAIKRIGVDWVKTQAPYSDLVGRFQGTFADAQEEEFLFGTLVLKDGTKQRWTAENLKVTNVFEMMANVSQAPNKFLDIFGYHDYDEN